ncbi:unnamed protein product (macronuclear) [Paramecium tetraurelia]|uniref:Transmembrane protein n=1 Tax=Paramecium tetraurelia TaxID=5888 RepID=A0CJ32_PARTE|nr:uncharacterized protein GSPATT00007934001 [Paramecium tetraurelia]CAK70799.1 unnamed protein product [Paramecium tetraurelia]|eukprot:XP_001438196.1 hypothetical protein (macronuclear) [Paramecium tetraurelia strain d4-2]
MDLNTIQKKCLIFLFTRSNILFGFCYFYIYLAQQCLYSIKCINNNNKEVRKTIIKPKQMYNVQISIDQIMIAIKINVIHIYTLNHDNKTQKYL